MSPLTIFQKFFTVEQRFWSYVCKGCDNSKHNHSKGCWIWISTLGSNGRYGQLSIDYKSVAAHRYAYYLKYGKLPTNQANHKCNQTICVRVDSEHVYDGTQADNIRDFYAKFRS